MIKKTALLLYILVIFALLLSACDAWLDNLDLPDSHTPQASAPSGTPTPAPLVIPSQTITPPSPDPSPEPSPKPDTFTLIAAGDIMAHSDNLKAALDEKSGLYDFTENYKHIRSIIEDADFSIANLETVTAGPESKYTSYPLFNTPAAILDAIKYAGFTTLVTANNHSLDRGIEGITATIDEIDKRSILHTGSFKSPGKNYLSYEFEGYNITVIAYTQHLNGNDSLLGYENKYMVNVMNKETIIEDITAVKENSDLVIIYLHWGNEYTRAEEDWQRSYAESLFEAGADVILGTHPHVIRPAETMTVNGEIKYVIYSMGNYISNFIRTDNRDNAIYTEDGVMVKLTFNIDKNGVFSLSAVNHIPTWPYKFEDESGLHYEIIPIEDPDLRQNENDYAHEQAILSYQRTMETLGTFTLE